MHSQKAGLKALHKPDSSYPLSHTNLNKGMSGGAHLSDHSSTVSAGVSDAADSFDGYFCSSERFTW